MAEKTSVEGQEELLDFDQEDLINGIGGALGLFLGWSILYIGNILISVICQITPPFIPSHGVLPCSSNLICCDYVEKSIFQEIRKNI